MMRLGIFVAAVLIPVQIFVGDLHGLNTLEHQPAKIAAIEGIWETESRVPLLLFALPNKEERRNDYAIAIPGMASFILTHDIDGEIKGLSEFGRQASAGDARYSGAFASWSASACSCWSLSWSAHSGTSCGAGSHHAGCCSCFAGMTFSGWVAVLAGWLTTEIGRQPYLVYGVLTTAEAASDVPASHIAITLVGYALVYSLLLVSYMVVVTQLAIKEAAGEKPAEPVESRIPVGHCLRNHPWTCH